MQRKRQRHPLPPRSSIPYLLGALAVGRGPEDQGLAGAAAGTTTQGQHHRGGIGAQEGAPERPPHRVHVGCWAQGAASLSLQDTWGHRSETGRNGTFLNSFTPSRLSRTLPRAALRSESCFLAVIIAPFLLLEYLLFLSALSQLNKRITETIPFPARYACRMLGNHTRGNCTLSLYKITQRTIPLYYGSAKQ